MVNSPLIRYLLTPFAALYGLGVRFRNYLFDKQVLKSRRFSVPLISIGNITVGGTGKTPHTEYLIRLFADTYRLAVLSRGYKRKTKGFVVARIDSSPAEVGDEPLQMKKKFSDVTVVVDEKRVEGVQYLMEGKAGDIPELILLDDAFQHRYITPSLSILLMDVNRPLYKDKLLPAGLMREPASSVKRADIVIVTKCDPDMTAKQRNEISLRMNLDSRQKLFFTTISYLNMEPVFKSADSSPVSLEGLDRSWKIFLVTGIATPTPIINELNKYTNDVVPLTYPDHHAFTEKDIRRIEKIFLSCPSNKKIILMTEKDAVRWNDTEIKMDSRICRSSYFLPISIKFPDAQEAMFNQILRDHVKSHTGKC